MKKRTRILLLISLAFFLLLFLVWLTWLLVERHRFNAALDDLRARSEPLSLEDLAPPPIPDFANAAPLYLRAFALLDVFPESDYAGLDEFAARPSSLSPDELSRAQVLLDRFSVPLGLLRRAASLPDCRFPLDYSRRAYAHRRPHLAGFLTSAQLLILSSQVNLASARPDLALDDCAAALRLADSLRDEPVLTSLFHRIRVHRLALRQLALVLDSADPSPPALRSLLAALGDTQDRSQFIRAIKGERCFGLSVFNDLFSSRLSARNLRDMGIHSPVLLTRLGVFALKPLLFRDATSYIQTLNAYDACSCCPWYLCSVRWRSLSSHSLAGTGEYPLTHPLLALLLPPIANAPTAFDWDLASRSAALQAVALRLCRLQHGAYPDSLSRLVPGFLPSLPSDPFSGKPFLYRTQPPGFILHSLGSNLTDEGGVVESSDHDTGDIVWRSSR